MLKVWLWKSSEKPLPQALHLLISRELDGSERGRPAVKFSLCYQPDTTPELATSLYRQMQRYWIERAFQDIKQELGMHRSGAPSVPGTVLDGLVSLYRPDDDGVTLYAPLPN